jgi:hypothetical protein
MKSMGKEAPASSFVNAGAHGWDGALLDSSRACSRLTPKCHELDAIQRISTATFPPGTDRIRLVQTRDLHQRLTSTFLQLVHTEEVTSQLTLWCRRGGVAKGDRTAISLVP